MNQDERAVTVTGEHATLVVTAAGHRWISLSRNGMETVHEASGEPRTVFTVPQGDHTVHTDGTLESVEVEEHGSRLALHATPRVTLHLECDAPDAHAADGVAEIPADGSTTTTITVRNLDPTGAAAGDEVFLRTTGGTLLAAGADTRTRSVHLRAGAASFRLLADTSPKLVTVFAFTTGSRTQLPIEFV